MIVCRAFRAELIDFLILDKETMAEFHQKRLTSIQCDVTEVRDAKNEIAVGCGSTDLAGLDFQHIFADGCFLRDMYGLRPVQRL